MTPASAPANIVINAVPLLSPLTGIGHYVSQLVNHFRVLEAQYRYTYYYGFFTHQLIASEDYFFRWRSRFAKIPWLRAGLREILRRLSGLHGEFDLYFEPNFIPLNIPARRIVTTVHDFSFHLFPDTHPKERVQFFRKHFFENIARSDRIITDSSYIKAEAEQLLAFPSDRITPILLGLDHSVFRPREPLLLERFRRLVGVPENFLLFVGTREPRKNLGRLLRAYLELPECIKKEFKLVLAGPEGWNLDMEAAARREAERHIVQLGYVTGEQLACLYNLAALFVFPSVYEGFGLPPLEAMACGCPVLVSRVASLPEVCGEAAIYVDPNEVTSIAGAISQVLDSHDLRNELARKGLERSRLFSWDGTAQKTLQVFTEVLAEA